MKKILMFICTFVLVLSLGACGEGEVEVKNPESVAITGLNTVEVGGSITLTAVVTPSGASQKVVWESSDIKIATVLNGVVKGVVEGEVTIKATATGTDKEGTLKVTVTKAKDKEEVKIPKEFEGIAQNSKVYLTTVGQSDQDIVYNIIDLAGIEEGKLVDNNLLNASDVAQAAEGEGKPVVILVTGSSNKGLGAAKTDANAEKARAAAFAEKAQSGDFVLIVLHIGGTNRRGPLSDPIIEAVAPSANLMLIVDTGNEDDFFTNISTNSNVPLVEYKKYSDMIAPFKEILGKE